MAGMIAGPGKAREQGRSREDYGMDVVEKRKRCQDLASQEIAKTGTPNWFSSFQLEWRRDGGVIKGFLGTMLGKQHPSGDQPQPLKDGSGGLGLFPLIICQLLPRRLEALEPSPCLGRGWADIWGYGDLVFVFFFPPGLGKLWVLGISARLSTWATWPETKAHQAGCWDYVEAPGLLGEIVFNGPGHSCFLSKACMDGLPWQPAHFYKWSWVPSALK